MPASSQQQQKLFGLALSVKRGETPRSEVSDDVLQIVDTMSEKKIKDFAETSHSGLPTKVESLIKSLVRDDIRTKILGENAALAKFSKLLDTYIANPSKTVNIEDLGKSFKKIDDLNQKKAVKLLKDKADYILDDDDFYSNAGWPVFTESLVRDSFRTKVLGESTEPDKVSKYWTGQSPIQKMFSKIGFIGSEWTHSELKNQLKNLSDQSLKMLYDELKSNKGIKSSDPLAYMFRNTSKDYQQKLTKLEMEKRGLLEANTTKVLGEASDIQKVFRKIGWGGESWKPKDYASQIKNLSDNTLKLWYDSAKTNKGIPNTPLAFQQKLTKLEMEKRGLLEAVNESSEQLDEKLITFSNRAPYGQVVFIAGGSGCFSPDTKIKTEFGYKFIKDIQIGDFVYSYNEETNQTELKPVLEVYLYKLDELPGNQKMLELKFDNGVEIQCTENHEFYIDGNWVMARDIELGADL